MESKEFKRPIKSMVDEAVSILTTFRFLEDADIMEIQKAISDAKLETLENYTNKKKKRLKNLIVDCVTSIMP